MQTFTYTLSQAEHPVCFSTRTGQFLSKEEMYKILKGIEDKETDSKVLVIKEVYKHCTSVGTGEVYIIGDMKYVKELILKFNIYEAFGADALKA